MAMSSLAFAPLASSASANELITSLDMASRATSAFFMSTAAAAAFTFSSNDSLRSPTFGLSRTSALRSTPLYADHDFATNYDPATLLNDRTLDTILQRSLRNTLKIASDVEVRRPFIVGHRGCLYDELENTRQGFRRAAEVGADAVELDVFQLKCGTLVVFHGSGSDDNPGELGGYCLLPGKSILDFTYEEAKQLVFNPDFEEFACGPAKVLGSTIPTLEEVLLDAKETGIVVKIELKGRETAAPVLELVRSLDMVSQCHFSSFDLDQIATVRRLHPERGDDGLHVYKTGALFHDVEEDFLQQAIEAGASEVHLRYDECTIERVNAIHAAGMESMAWFRGPVGMKTDCQSKFLDVGNEDPSMYRTVLQTGVRQLCVNKPDVLVNMWKLAAEVA